MSFTKIPYTQKPPLGVGVSGYLADKFDSFLILNERGGKIGFDAIGNNHIDINSGAVWGDTVNDSGLILSGSVDVEKTNARKLPETKGSFFIDCVGNRWTTNQEGIVELSDGTGGNRILLYHTPSTLYTFFSSSAGGAANKWTKGSIGDILPNGVRSRFLVTFDSSMSSPFIIYINGELITPTSNPNMGTDVVLDQVNIGTFYDKTNDFDGDVFSFGFSNKVLTQSDALLLNDVYKNVAEPRLMPFGEDVLTDNELVIDDSITVPTLSVIATQVSELTIDDSITVPTMSVILDNAIINELVIDDSIEVPTLSVVAEQVNEAVVIDSIEVPTLSVIVNQVSELIIDDSITVPTLSVIVEQVNEVIVIDSIEVPTISVILLNSSDNQLLINDSIEVPTLSVIVTMPDTELLIDDSIEVPTLSVVVEQVNEAIIIDSITIPTLSVIVEQVNEAIIIDSITVPELSVIVGQVSELIINDSITIPELSVILNNLSENALVINDSVTVPTMSVVLTNGEPATPVELIINNTIPLPQLYVYERRDPVADFGYPQQQEILVSSLKLLYPQGVFPVVSVNKNDVFSSRILFKDNVLPTIDTVLLALYECEPVVPSDPLAVDNAWRTIGANIWGEGMVSQTNEKNLCTSELTVRFDPTTLPDWSTSIYYFIPVIVNKNDDSTVPQAYIELIIKILNHV